MPARTAERAWSHLAVWMIPLVVLAVNAFWWLPGIWLASTKGASDFAFVHPEGVSRRLVADRRYARRRFRASCWRPACRACSCSAARSDRRAGLCSDSAPPGCSGDTWRRACGPSISCSRAGTPMRSTRRWRSPAARDSTSCCRRLRVGPHGVDHLDRWVMAGLALIGIRIWDIPWPVDPRPARVNLEVRFVESWGFRCLDRPLAVGPESRSCRAGRRRACSGSSTCQATMSSPASACLYEEGGRPSRRARSVSGRTIQRPLAGAHRGRGDRRPLSPRVVEDQLHPVR